MKNTCFDKDFELFCMFSYNFFRVNNELPDVDSWTVKAVKEWMNENALVVTDGKVIITWKDDYHILTNYEEVLSKL